MLWSSTTVRQFQFSAANSMVFLHAFSWISLALDQSLERTGGLYSVRIGIGTTTTISLKPHRFFGFLLEAVALSSAAAVFRLFVTVLWSCCSA
jgi:hypothetical protein